MKNYAWHLHRCSDPWEEAPPWALELRFMLGLIIQEELNIMASLDDLAADVQAENTVIDSAVALINGFAAQLAAAGTDPVKLDALRSDIQTRTQALAAAVAANTPASG